MVPSSPTTSTEIASNSTTMPKALQSKKYSRPNKEERANIISVTERRVTKSILEAIEKQHNQPMYLDCGGATLKDKAKKIKKNIVTAIEVQHAGELGKWWILRNVMHYHIRQGMMINEVVEACDIRRDEYHGAYFLSEVLKKKVTVDFMTMSSSDIKRVTEEGKRRIMQRVRKSKEVLYEELPNRLEFTEVHPGGFSVEEYD